MSSRNDHPGGGNPNEPPALDPVEDAALRWLLDLQAADGDAETQRAFEVWRSKDPRHRAAFARVADLWRSTELRAAVTRHADGDGPSGFGGNEARFGLPAWHRSPTRARRLRTRQVGAIAAVLILAVAVAYLAGLSTYLQADYVTATGHRMHVALPDGSTMQLNSGSAVAVDFSTDRRTVRLIEGEAFFEVVRDPGRPFRVSGPHVDVEVTGTSFSVRTTAERDNVTVQHGKVSVLPKYARVAAVNLLPQQSVSVSTTGPGMIQSVNVGNALAWLDGRIRFHNRQLGHVLDDLRRHHRGLIIVTNDRIKNIRVSGNYRLDDPALIVASLAEAVGANLTRLSDYILILR